MTGLVQTLLTQRDTALLALDMEWARRMMPTASCDEVRLIAMHKARYELRHLPREARMASGNWLRKRRYGRLNGGEVLAEGVLPGDSHTHGVK